jgi:hypothetical protein
MKHAAWQVGFNSDQLASSIIANDYSNFARTFDYMLLTTPSSRRI